MAMKEVFLRNIQLLRNGSGPTLLEDSIRNILRESGAPQPHTVTTNRAGILLAYSCDRDINQVLTRAKSSFEPYGFVLKVGYSIQHEREVIISDIPSYVLEETPQHLMQDLQRENNIDIIVLDKISNNRIKVALKCKEDKAEILRRGRVYLRNSRLVVRDIPPPPSQQQNNIFIWLLISKTL